MRNHWLIGNDIVDLTSDETLHHLEDRHANHRFIERVFTLAERTLIHTQADPLRTLWSIWAGKEAAYKAMSKHDPETIFAHQQFEMSENFKTIRYQKHSLELHWEHEPEFVHCVAALGLGPVKIFTRIEPLTTTHLPLRAQQSLAVRKLAHAILREELHLEDTEIQGVPPQVWVAKQPLPHLDLSLSHHEGWLAAALALSYNH